jgi:hypothetical protein
VKLPLVAKIKAYIIPFLFFVTLFSALYAQALRLNFLLIDDGQLVLVKRQTVNLIVTGNITALPKLLLEPEVGRVRPVYWLIQSALVYLNQESAFGLHLTRQIILVITLLLIARILSVFKTDRRLIFVLLILFIFNQQNLENYYRLGPTEPYLALCFLLILNLLLKPVFSKSKNLVTALVLFMLGCGIKETFVINGLIFGLIGFRNKSNGRLYLISFIAAMILSASLIWGIKSSYPHLAGAYSSNYSLNINGILANAYSYFQQLLKYQKQNIYILFIILLGLFISPEFRRTLFKDKLLLGGLSLGLIINLAILFPWQFAMGRYLLVFNALILLFIGYVISSPILPRNFLKNRLWLFPISVALSFVFLSLPINLVEISNFQRQQLFESAFTTDIITKLNNYLPKNSILLNNYIKGDDNIEIYLEALWHLQLFHGRYDLNYGYLEKTDPCAQVTRYIFDRKSTRLVPRDQLLSHLELLASTSADLVQTVPEKLFRDFIEHSPVPRWIVSFPFDWSLFKQNPGVCI